jgi:hypothetical protein
VSEPAAVEVVAEVPAPAAITEDVVVAEAVAEAPAEVVAEAPAEAVEEVTTEDKPA